MQQRAKPEGKYDRKLFTAPTRPGESFGKSGEIFPEQGIRGSGVGVFSGCCLKCGAGSLESAVRGTGNRQYRNSIPVIQSVSGF